MVYWFNCSEQSSGQLRTYVRTYVRTYTRTYARTYEICASGLPPSSNGYTATYFQPKPRCSLLNKSFTEKRTWVVYVRLYLGTYVFTHVRMYVRAHVRTYVRITAHTCVHADVRKSVRTSVRTYVSTYIYISCFNHIRLDNECHTWVWIYLEFIGRASFHKLYTGKQL